MANKLKAALANSVAAPETKPEESGRTVAKLEPPKPVIRTRSRPATENQLKPGRSDRAGRVLIGGHFESELARRWNILAAEQGMTKQELLREAIEETLKRYNAR